MKKLEDLKKHNEEYGPKREKGIREAIEFLKENEGQAFTNNEIEEKFGVILPSYEILCSSYSPPNTLLEHLGCIMESGTREEYYFYRLTEGEIIREIVEQKIK